MKRGGRDVVPSLDFIRNRSDEVVEKPMGQGRFPVFVPTILTCRRENSFVSWFSLMFLKACSKYQQYTSGQVCLCWYFGVYQSKVSSHLQRGIGCWLMGKGNGAPILRRGVCTGNRGGSTGR
jgi:hypothetical protein